MYFASFNTAIQGMTLKDLFDFFRDDVMLPIEFIYDIGKPNNVFDLHRHISFAFIVSWTILYSTWHIKSWPQRQPVEIAARSRQHAEVIPQPRINLIHIDRAVAGAHGLDHFF